MQSVVQLMDAGLPCQVTANRADLSGEGVVYTFNTTFYNGSRREARMKLHIYAATMARGLEIEGMIDRLLVKKGDRRLTPTATACQRNGGGWLEDGDWHIRIAYYDIILRK